MIVSIVRCAGALSLAAALSLSATAREPQPLSDEEGAPVRASVPDTAPASRSTPAAMPAAGSAPSSLATPSRAPADASTPASTEAPGPAGMAPRERESLRFDLDAEGGSWMISADLDAPWSPALEDAVRRGVPLYFVLEFELLQPRWWWTDRVVVERSKVTRLAWHALTRQYRVTADGLTQTWETLADALDTMRKVRHWRVFDAASAAAGSRYVARLRLRLDTSQLPKPLQLNAMTDREWNPPAEWRHSGFQP